MTPPLIAFVTHFLRYLTLLIWHIYLHFERHMCCSSVKMKRFHGSEKTTCIVLVLLGALFFFLNAPHTWAPWRDVLVGRTFESSCIDKLLQQLIPSGLTHSTCSVMLVQIPYGDENKPKASRDLPRITLNEKYSQQHGYGYSTCSGSPTSVRKYLPGMRNFRGHLLKPYCLLSTMLSNPNVQWFIFLDSDAVINPLRFHEPLLPYLEARLENAKSVVFVTSDTPLLDGCSGVLLAHSRAREYVCLWAQEVANNVYGLWDQNALWSIFERLLANSFKEFAPYQGSVRDGALQQVDKTVPPSRSNAAWTSIYHQITQEPKFLRLGPLFALENLAPLYARQDECGLDSSWFFHPAGTGQLCARDDGAVKNLSTLPSYNL